jgi:cation diffusion facilitator family transporter
MSIAADQSRNDAALVRVLGGAFGIGIVLVVGKVAFSLYCLLLSSRPPDARHPYGHGQIENISALVEGSLIVGTGVLVAVRGIQNLLHPGNLRMSQLGMWLVIAAGAINVALGVILWRLGRRHRTLILESSGRHMLADSYTSIGAVLGFGLAILTGWQPFDAIAALLIALAIGVSGVTLLRRAVAGLMHEVDPAIDMEIQRVLHAERDEHGWDYHAVRHRRVGRRVFVELNLHFRPGVTLEEAHGEASHVEHQLNEALPFPTTVVTHLEPSGHKG